VIYAHVAVQDICGNRRWQTLGPIYVDAPSTPDYITDSGVACGQQITEPQWRWLPCRLIGGVGACIVV